MIPGFIPPSGAPPAAESAGPNVPGVTGVILAGGASRRMGSTKALLRLGGVPLIELVHRTLANLFERVIIVTNTPETYAFLSCRTVPDVYPGAGAIAGLHAGMAASSTERIFVAACDMPFLHPGLIRMLCRHDPRAQAVVPLNGEGFFEPLHAVYGVSALDTARDLIENGDRSILVLLKRIRTLMIPYPEVCAIPGAGESFRNLNTPEEFRAAMARG